MADMKTVVKTAEGDVKEFGDWVSKITVAHPKMTCFCVLVAGWVIGHMMH